MSLQQLCNLAHLLTCGVLLTDAEAGRKVGALRTGRPHLEVPKRSILTSSRARLSWRPYRLVRPRGAFQI